MRADAARYFAEKERLTKRRLMWDHRFLRMAEEVSTWSKDPSTKVGAIITRDNEFISLGYNGLPRKMKDDDRLKDREWKYKKIVHGEINAIHHADKSLEGCTLYIVPFMPCSVCASQIVQVGIKRVVTYRNDNERWAESFALTEETFKECGVSLVLYEKGEDDEVQAG